MGREGGKRPVQVLRNWGLLSGATEKPYLVEEAVSYNELDYVSVSSVPSVGVCCRAGLPEPLTLRAAEQGLSPVTASGVGHQLICEQLLYMILRIRTKLKDATSSAVFLTTLPNSCQGPRPLELYLVATPGWASSLPSGPQSGHGCLFCQAAAKPRVHVKVWFLAGGPGPADSEAGVHQP